MTQTNQSSRRWDAGPPSRLMEAEASRQGGPVGPVRRLVLAGLVLSCLCSALFGCSRRTQTTAPPLRIPEAFSASGTRQVPDRWWTAFADKALNQIVDQALAGNFDLKTAWERLREARAIADAERASLFPQLDGFIRGEASRSESEDTELLRLGLTSEYEIDLWGRIRSSLEAERYRAEASLADYQTAGLSLSAEVVRTWYQLQEAQGQLAVLQEQVEANRKILELLKSRFGSGQVRSVDVLRQQQLLEATRQQQLAAQARARVLEHQLAALAGQSPEASPTFSGQGLPEVPAWPKTGLPADLVRRRPDIRRAYSLLQAADSDLAAAVSNRYPRLTLTASLATFDGSSGRLFEDWIRSAAGDLIGPLFDAGQLAAEVDRTRALKRQRLFEYCQAVLDAFQEVEDALIGEKKQAAQIRSLESQLELARQASEQLRLEYFNGQADFIDVLTALTDQQELRRDLLAARLRRVELRVALYRALAGGFEADREMRGDHPEPRAEERSGYPAREASES